MAKYTCYYELNNSKYEAKCKLCITPAILKFSASSKTNLKKHFETVHRHVTPEQAAAAVGSLPLHSAFQGPSTFSGQDATTDAIVDMIIDLNLPISIVDKPSFRKSYRTASGGKYKPICKKTARSKIIQKGNGWIFNYSAYKAKFGKPSTTVDIWSSKKRRGFMAVSLHLQTDDGLETKVLDLAHIPSPHTGTNVKLKYDEILNKHGLDCSDTFKTVSDNASNMKKAFKVSLWDENDREEDDEIHGENEDVEDGDEVNDMEVNFHEVFQGQYRRPCTIHTLQLLVHDCLKLLPSRFVNILAKAKMVAKKQHMSTKLSEAMSKQLPQSNETCWNGQYRLLKSIEGDFAEVRDTIGIFVDSDLDPMNCLTSFLTPFFYLTKQLESEKLTTVQEIIPCFCKLEKDITKCKSMPKAYLDSCLVALENRFAFITSDMHLITATVLSPHGLKWLKVARATNAKLRFDSEEVLLEKVKVYLGTLVSEVQPLLDKTKPSAKLSSDPSNLYGYDDEEEFSDPDWMVEFDQHLLRTSSLQPTLDASAYWKTLPHSVLQVVALMVLAVPASSAPVERIFSHSGLICSSKRTSMKMICSLHL